MLQPFDDNVDPRALKDILFDHAAAHAPIPEQRWSDEQAQVILTNTSRSVSSFEVSIEQLLKLQIRLLGKPFSVYNAFGVLGMVLAGTIAWGLTLARGLSPFVMLGLSALAFFISILHIVLTTLITGRDSLVFLRYFLSIMAASALLLRLIDQPILPYLENLMLGIGAMQGVGRIGCLRVGCCYGKPAHFGIRYTKLHARAGFPDPLVGVRLFPIQLLESSWVLLSAGVGVSLALFSHTEALGLSTYILLFSSGRFYFELLRGDNARPYLGSLSEAQWISLAMVCCVVALELAGFLPFHYWHVFIGICLLIGFLFVMYISNSSPVFRLRKPASIFAVAKALGMLEKGRTQNLSGSHAVHLRQVAPALQISDGLFLDQNQVIHHYTLSYADRKMPATDAIAIAKMIQSWHPQEEKSKLINHNTNVFHLLRYHTIES